MVSFLAPYALFGSLLLAVPILVHLFRPRKVRQTPFSSLRWLRHSPHKLSRRIQWHQVLLFLVRAAFVMALVCALARPVLGPTADARRTDRFIILDVSRSMDYRVGGRPSPFELAQQVAEALLTSGQADDRTALLLTGSRTRILTPPTRDAAAQLPKLHNVQAGLTDTDLSSALPVIRPMLNRCPPDTRVELYFLTDNHQRSWDQGTVAAFLKDLPVPVRVHLVDVGVTAAQNAWITSTRLLQSSQPARRALRVDVATVGAEQERTVFVTGITGMAERSQAVTLSPGRPTSVDFELPVGLDLRGQVAHIRLEPADALPSDDQFFLALDQQAALRILLVGPDAGSESGSRPGLHLQTAVEVLGATANRSLELASRTSITATPRDFEEADLVLLAGIPDLTEAQLAALEGRVRSGGGLVFFLGPTVKAPFYNNRLYRPLQPSEGLLPLPLKEVAEPLPPRESPAPLSSIHWTHPLLAPLYDPVLGDLATTRFRRFYRFGALPAQRANVLAWIDDDVPAVVEHSFGAGKVILFNTTANDDWSDLPRRKSFVPLIDRLVSYLTAGGVRRSFEVGEAVTLPLADFAPGETVTVRTPDGGIRTPALSSAAGRTMLRLEEVTQPGVYRVERATAGTPEATFVVNVGRGDSVLTPMDTAALAKWWEPSTFESMSPDAALRQVAPSERRDLWPWLVALAGLLLLVETFLVHWLCPRVNPAVTEAIVRRRGLLRPLNAAAE
jgi:hypothetical protein